MNSTPRFVYTLRKVFIFLLFAVFQLSYALGQNPGPTLIYPKTGSVFLPGDVPFQWNALTTTATYHLQVSEQISFATPSFSNPAVATPFYNVSALPADKRLYWRVRAFDGTAFTNWSAVDSFYLLNPRTLGSMQLWTRGDSGAIVSGAAVTQWTDYSGNNVQVVQVDATRKPTRVTTHLNGLPALRFDGVNDFLDGGQNLELRTNDQTILIVFNSYNLPNEQYRLIQKRGHTTNTDGWCLALRGDQWGPSIIQEGANIAAFQGGCCINDGNYRIASTVWDNSAALWNLYINGNFDRTASLTGILNGADITQNFNKIMTIGNSWNSASDQAFFLNGNIAEIMVYHTPLDSATRSIAEQYLRFKYAPPVNLERDVVLLNGLCGQIGIDAGAGFTSYQWSNGDTTRFTQVGAGTHNVTVTDIFGFVSYDDIVVTGIAINALPDIINLCIGDTLVWDTQLGSGNYSFQWHNGSINSNFTITTAGLHWVEITDTTFGCVLRDSAYVVTAPCCNASFNFLNQGATYSFQNTSIGDSLSYLWKFPNGLTSTQQNPVHTFSTPEADLVCLHISNNAGCSDSACYFVRIHEAANAGSCCNYYTSVVANTTIPSDSASVVWSSAFSPNNDGSNDTWRSFASRYQNISITVSRNGEVAFQSNNENTLWDGTCNGFPVEGLFDVVVVLTSPSGGTFEKRGTVCVWRDCVSNENNWDHCTFPSQYDGADFAQTLSAGESVVTCGTWFCLGPDSTVCGDSTNVYPGCGDLVWPGDANHDGIANNQDILPIGIAYGISGFTRPNATTNWVGQPAPDWALQLAGGANLKHVDCDGDAVIDSNDAAVITLNYGMSHPKGGTPRKAIAGLFLVFPADSFFAGDSVYGELHLGIPASPISDVYGLAFSIRYDQNLVDSNSFRIDFVNSWFTPQGNGITLTKDLYLASKIDAGISRIDHTNTSGAGKIADVSFVIQDNIDGKDFLVLPLEIQFEDVVAIDKDEVPLSIAVMGDTLYVKEEIIGIPGAPVHDAITLFPNPATNELYMLADFSITKYRILDLAGREIVSSPVEPGKTLKAFKINLSALEAGSYFIQLVKENSFTVSRKIVVLR